MALFFTIKQRHNNVSLNSAMREIEIELAVLMSVENDVCDI